MKMTFTKSAFEMPDGKYLARFTGVTLREATGQLDQRGNPMPPGMTWDFEIIEPAEHAGKKLDRLTGRNPTPKSGCGKFLAAISDSVLKDGQQIDLNDFVGAIYRVTVQENRASDNPAPVRVYDHPAANGAAPAKPAPSMSTSSPPRRPAAPPSAPASKFWVALSDSAEPTLMTTAEVKHTYETSSGVDWSAVQLCLDGSEQWLPLATLIPESKSWSPF